MSEISRPSTVNPCECDTDLVQMSDDGMTVRYDCAACGALLADLIIGSEP